MREPESPWVCWRLGLLVSNPDRGGLLCSIERCFELGGWDVAAVTVEAVFVEPVHPRQRRELEFIDIVPWARRIGSEDALSLVEPVRGLGEGVIERVRDRADRGSRADLVEPLGEPHGRELRSRVRMSHEADEAPVAA